MQTSRENQMILGATKAEVDFIEMGAGLMDRYLTMGVETKLS